MTEYIVLRQDTDVEPSPWYVHTAIVKASSARQAISRINVDFSNAGHFVAVPVRSWKPLAVKVEQTTKITIG